MYLSDSPYFSIFYFHVASKYCPYLSFICCNISGITSLAYMRSICSRFIFIWFSDQATKRHLTQRIENLDGKLDEQVEISKLIRNEVHMEGKITFFWVILQSVSL